MDPNVDHIAMHTVGQRLGNCREDGVAPCPGQRCEVEVDQEVDRQTRASGAPGAN